jgi:hypothetical protein
MRIYDDLRSFPRLGLIAYGDAFTINHSFSDDFSVSIESELVTAYASAISSEYFLQSLQKKPINSVGWVRTLHRGYVYDDSIYIPVEIIGNDIKNTDFRQIITINNKEYIESSKIPNKKINLCTDKRVIYLDNIP